MILDRDEFNFAARKNPSRINPNLNLHKSDPTLLIFILTRPSKTSMSSAQNPPPPPPPYHPNYIITDLNEEEIAYLASKFKNIRIPKQKISLSTPAMRNIHDKWNENQSILHGENKDPEAVSKELKAIWRCQKVEIVLKEPNRFACNFDRIQDRVRVFNYQPWLINEKFLVLIKPYSSDMDAKQIGFDTVPVWIQFFGLHIDHISEENIRSIASGAGEVLAVEPSGAPPRSIAGYRAKVNINITEPVKQNNDITTINDGLVCVDYVYVNLPECYCSRCEIIGFDRLDCNCLLQIENAKFGDNGGTVLIPNAMELGQHSGTEPKMKTNKGKEIQTEPSPFKVQTRENNDPSPSKPIGSELKFLPHQIMGKNEKAISIEGSGGNSGKKRKMMTKFEENPIQTDYTPHQPTQILHPDSMPITQTPPLNIGQFWDLMLVPEVVTQLVEQGVINPAIYGFLNIDNQLSLAEPQPGTQGLDNLESQFYATQLAQIAQNNGKTGEENFLLGGNSGAEGFADNIATVDHLGAMESRASGDAIFGSQSNASLTPTAAYEFVGDQVQYPHSRDR